MNWAAAAAKLSRDNAGFVLVTVLSTAGSAPRESGAKMAVDRRAQLRHHRRRRPGI